MRTRPQFSLKQLLTMVGVAAVVCLVGIWLAKTRAPDFWGYGKSSGMPGSAVYQLEVRGVSSNPTVVRIVRFPDQASAPRNSLEVSHAVSNEFDSLTQNADRWNRECLIIAGRNNSEKILITMATDEARKLFSYPGNQFSVFTDFEKLWEDHIVDRLPKND